MQLLVRKFATSRVFVLSGWIFAFLFSFIWRHSHGNVKGSEQGLSEFRIFGIFFVN